MAEKDNFTITAKVPNEEELAKDVLEIITVFSTRLYGARSNKNKKLLDEMQDVIVANIKERI